MAGNEVLTTHKKNIDVIEEKSDMEEVVVQIKRTSKKTKGGDRLGFTALAVVGDKAGRVGVALGKAPGVRPAIQKAMRKARSQMIEFPLVGRAKTIPHEIEMKNGASRVLIKPAPAGTGIRAGGAIRAVLEAAGIENVVAKRLGSSNKKSCVDTVLMALQGLSDPAKRISSGKKEKKSKKKGEE